MIRRIAIAAAVTSLACADAAPSLSTVSAPTPITTVGVIEGFYGTPWTHRDRLDLLRFMGRQRMNVYVYAPKDDPYHRTRWRDAYPPRERALLQQLADTATANGVALWYAISPGLSITYSSPADYRALVEKIEAIAGMGIVDFGLFLDDVPTQLAHERDRARYATLADAHADLANRLHADLRERGLRLSVTPTTYTDAWGNRDYARRLGALVDSTIPLFWTGPDVAPPRITAAQAEAWGQLISRPPMVWDNYPVNDFARWRLFLGPLSGRDPALGAHVLGWVSNPMNEAHASMIPLATLATYAANPAAYDPEDAAREAVLRLYGEDVARALEPFLEIYGGDAWSGNVFEQLYFLTDTIDLAPAEEAIAQLQRSMTNLSGLASTGTESLPPLREEIAPFVQLMRERVEQLRDDARYEARRSRLVYRSTTDRRPAETREIALDGQLDDWAGAVWHTMTPANRAPRVGIARSDSLVYLAVRVADQPERIRRGAAVGEGDHVALLVDVDPGDGGIGPADVLALIGAPEEDQEDRVVVTTLGFRGFMTKYLADNENLTFTEFHITTFGDSAVGPSRAVAHGMRHAVRLTADGYVAEIAFRAPQRDTVRVSLTVSAQREGRRRTFSLAQRNYPGNPATYARIVLVP
jgi:hypothetical protein